MTKDSGCTARLGTTLALLILFFSSLSAFAGVTISSPASGATVPSPVHVAASATSSNGSAITTMRIYVESYRLYQISGNRIDTYLPMKAGRHTLTVKAWDTAGIVYKAQRSITVSSSSTQPIAVSISPTSASVIASKTQQFSASVTGTSNTSVTWQVNGTNGGSASTGTISSSGLFTAPAATSQMSVTVTAVSNADNGKYASATVTVSPASTPPPTSSGPALYVSPSGSDSNDGSAAHPFATIQKAANVVTAGTTVHVAPGVYQAVTTSKSGTSSQRIRYISDVQWGAKIMGSSGIEAVWMQDGNYVDIVGFDISTGSRLGVENNGSNVRILGNYVHNIPGDCSGNGGAGIDNANYSASNDDIIGNIVGNIGPAIGTCNTVQGIYLSNYGGVTANNIVFAVSAWGIQMWHAATNATIVNNTVFNCYGGITVGAGDSPGGVTADNTLVANNIVYKNVGYGIYEFGATGTHNRYINNLVTGNPTEIALLNGLSASATVTADPQFVNYQANGTGDYHLQSTSPAINTGTSASAPSTDFSGAARPVGGAWDLGAYEYGSTPATWPWY